jgi:ABC-type Fe2+-enterobactin transport system substrate-binding protein
MVESLDVFVAVERDNLIWIGSASTDDAAVHLIRNYSLTQPGLFLVYSRKSEQRSLYMAGLGNDVRKVAESHVNFRAALLAIVRRSVC